MNNVKKHIQIMLLPLAVLYTWGVALRNFLFDHHILHSSQFSLPVICIGNLTVGGTGKTPHTEYLIQLLYEQFHIAVVSRGYKRKTKGLVLASAESTSTQIGDEPYQIKCKFPAITLAVCAKRVKAIHEILNNNAISTPDIILLDDAYQHRYVKAGLNILLTDYHRPIYADRMLPSGHLRESFKGRNRADIVIVTKCPVTLSAEEMNSIKQKLQLIPTQQLFFSTLKYGALQSAWSNESTRLLSTLNAQIQVLLVTGIARPEPILHELHQTGAQVSSICYPDHHHFSAIDLKHIDKIYGNLQEKGETIIVTTEKDASRLRFCTNITERVQKHLYILPVEISILNNQQSQFNQIIINYVRKNK